MKKVAILTLPLNNNYGGIMQAYALQKVLRNMGHSPITIDRRGSRYSLLMRVMAKIAKQILVRYRKKTVFNKKQLEIIDGNSTKFIQQYIQRSVLIENDKEMQSHFVENFYDAIVVGSDQVWRQSYSPNIYNFFIDFKNLAEKKISYAASFGTDEWDYTDKQSKVIRELMKNFTAVSVREQSGVDFCSQYLGVDAQLVLDPTMLLKKEDYLELICQNVKGVLGETKGIYTYVLDKGESKKRILDFCSETLGKPMFFCHPLEWAYMSSSRNIEDYVFPPVEEWVKGFYDADFIVTDSFHGTVFSIIFNKPFITIANKKRGLGRFLSLLSLLGLEDRLVYDIEDIKEESIKVPIDYNIVNEKLDMLRNDSLEFLEKNI